MANINKSSINRKLNAYAKTSTGKKQMKNTIEQDIHNNVPETKAGGDILTEAKMIEAAEVLINCLKESAKNKVFADSIIDNFNSLDYEKPVKLSDGNYEISISFNDDLTRESLVPDKYPEVNNIINLLNRGYHAKNRVFGYWRHSDDPAKPIPSKSYREGLHFLEDAIHNFNNEYGAKYNAVAKLGDEYI